MNTLARPAAIVVLLLGMTAASAQVSVNRAWIRGTVPGQKTSAAYMQLKSTAGAALVGADSPAARTAEIHEMRMEGNIMRMRQVTKLDLPPGRTVELKPGGYHLMLVDLREPLKTGDTVPIKLKIEGRGGQVQEIDVKAEIRELTAASPTQHKH